MSFTFKRPIKESLDKHEFANRELWAHYSATTVNPENAESPILFAKALEALQEYRNNPEYLCRLPVGLDATASG